MPSYDDQLAAYRSQLASISSMQAQTASNVPGTGPMATAGLAFNTMMSDMSRMASHVGTFSTTPAYSSIPLSRSTPSNMGFGQALGAISGLSSNQTSMYMADYQYLANERIARSVGGGMTTALTGSLEFGGGIVGGMALGAAGGAIGGSIVPGVGTAIGAVVGGLAGGFLGASAMTPIGAPAFQIASAAQQLQLSTPAVFGGMGISREASRSLARDLSRQAIGRSEGWLASPADEMNLANMAISQGTKFGLFAGTTDTASFSKELGELTTTIKEMSRAIRVSKEEMVPILAEMRQGGFYGAKTGGQAILQGSGLAYGAGVGFQEMHEMGLRGATMFRGTSIPTAIGYQTGQTSLFNVKRMMQTGAVDPEAINQLGGVTGTAEALTAGTANFIQGPLGRQMQAALMKGRGGVNTGALQDLASGKNLGDILAGAEMDPNALADPEVRQKFWKTLGSEGIQLAQASFLSGRAKFFQEQGFSTEESRSMAFRQSARAMGMDPNDAARQNVMNAMMENLPNLMAEQRGNMNAERRRASEERMNREKDIWGMTGIREDARKIRRGFQPISEAYSGATEWASDKFRDLGDFVQGVRRVEGDTDVARAFKVVGVGGFEGATRQGGTLSEFDYLMAEAAGTLDKDTFSDDGRLRRGIYEYTPRKGLVNRTAVKWGAMGTAIGPLGTAIGYGAGLAVGQGSKYESEANYEARQRGVQAAASAAEFKFKNDYVPPPALESFLFENRLGDVGKQVIDASKSGDMKERAYALTALIAQNNKALSDFRKTPGSGGITDAEVLGRMYSSKKGMAEAVADLTGEAGTSTTILGSWELQQKTAQASAGIESVFGKGSFSKATLGDMGNLATLREYFTTGQGTEAVEALLAKNKDKIDIGKLDKVLGSAEGRKKARAAFSAQEAVTGSEILQKRFSEGDFKASLSDLSNIFAISGNQGLKDAFSNLRTGTGDMRANLDHATEMIRGLKDEDLKAINSSYGQETVKQIQKLPGGVAEFLVSQATPAKKGEIEAVSASERAQSTVMGYRRVPGTNQQTDINGQTLLALRQINSELKARGASNTPGAPTTGATNNKGPG